MQVYFCATASMPDCKADATRKEERAVGRTLRGRAGVGKVVYVSKAEGLAQANKQNPGLFTVPLAVNPLPDKLVVTVKSGSLAAAGEAICASRLAGVEPCPAAGSAELGDAGGVQW